VNKKLIYLFVVGLSCATLYGAGPSLFGIEDHLFEQDILHFLQAFENRNFPLMKQLIDINGRKLANTYFLAPTHKDEYTVLHRATMNEDLEMINFLLSHQANINAPRRSDGATPLLITYNPEIVSRLLQSPHINVNAKILRGPKKGVTALHRAAATNNVPILQRLLAHTHSDVNASAQGDIMQGVTPLFLAASMGNELAAAQLLDHPSININITLESGTYRGYKPLHRAAERGQTSIVKLLLGKGAEKDAQEAKGHTALHVAAGNGHEECVSLLLNYGANATIKNNNNKTPLDIAIEENKEEVIDVLSSHSRKRKHGE